MFPDKFRFTFIFFTTCILFLPGAAMAQALGHDPQTESLLAQMTLDEKVGQMTQVDMGALKNPAAIEKYFLGSMLSGGDSDPTNNTPEAWLNAVNAYQAWALKTRLKIPLLYGIDAVHGHNNIDGAVIFPHNIGLGATHNPGLIEQAEHITAEEMAGTGIRWAFAPCIAVARNERWGRTYESFGQSADLVSEMSAAAVRGLQGAQLSSHPTSVLACAKHFLGDGGTKGGVDQGDTVCDEAALREVFLPPYREAIKAGVGSIMVSFNSWNGQKMSGNKYLLTDVLKGELGFQGFLVSDWAAIDQLSGDYKRDVEVSVNAGLDMVMIPNGPGQKNNYTDFIRDLKELVVEGKVAEARIDDAVRRILRVKFQMGLFEHPYPAESALTAAIGSTEHREVARQCVEQSVVLLKDKHHALPLSKNLKRLLVVGKGADDLGMQCGGWTIDWQGKTGGVTHGGTTLLAAIHHSVSPGTEVIFSPDGSETARADAIIVVIGELPYAESKGDRTNLDLAPKDIALVEKVKKTKASKAPVITVLYSGRPLILGAVLDKSDALVAAWLPGTEGQGLVNVLFGDYKPTGKLARAWPRNNSQLSADSIKGKPLFPEGFGLGYSE
jgi:beta-glucosidase